MNCFHIKKQKQSSYKETRCYVDEVACQRILPVAIQHKNGKALPMPKDTHNSVSPSWCMAEPLSRQNQYQLCGWGSCGHWEQRGRHALLYGCRLLRGFQEPRLQYLRMVVCSRHHFLQWWSLSASRNESWRTLERKLNSTLLFSSTWKKLVQFLEITALFNTCHLTPFPRLALAVPLNEFVL